MRCECTWNMRRRRPRMYLVSTKLSDNKDSPLLSCGRKIGFTRTQTMCMAAHRRPKNSRSINLPLLARTHRHHPTPHTPHRSLQPSKCRRHRASNTCRPRTAASPLTHCQACGWNMQLEMYHVLSMEWNVPRNATLFHCTFHTVLKIKNDHVLWRKAKCWGSMEYA